MTRVQQLLTVILVAATGCYTYAPIELSEVRPEMKVRARLTLSQAESLPDMLNVADRLVQGEVLAADATGITLLVPVVPAVRRGRGPSLGQRLALPDRGIVELELRTVDRTRTTLVTVAGALVTGFVLYKSLEGGGGGAPTGPGGSTSDARIPIRIPLRW